MNEVESISRGARLHQLSVEMYESTADAMQEILGITSLEAKRIISGIACLTMADYAARAAGWEGPAYVST